MRSKYRTPDQHAASYDEAQRVSTSKVFGADHRFTFDLLIFSARARITVAPPIHREMPVSHYSRWSLKNEDPNEYSTPSPAVRRNI